MVPPPAPILPLTLPFRSAPETPLALVVPLTVPLAVPEMLPPPVLPQIEPPEVVAATVEEPPTVNPAPPLRIWIHRHREQPKYFYRQKDFLVLLQSFVE